MHNKFEQCISSLGSELQSLDMDFQIQQDEGISNYCLTLKHGKGAHPFFVFPERRNGFDYVTVCSSRHPSIKTSRRLDLSMDRLASKIQNSLLMDGLNKDQQEEISAARLESKRKSLQEMSVRFTERYASAIHSKEDNVFVLKQGSKRAHVDFQLDENRNDIHINLSFEGLSEEDLQKLVSDFVEP